MCLGAHQEAIQLGFEHMSDSKALAALFCACLAPEVLSASPASALDPCSGQCVPGLTQLILHSRGPTHQHTRKAHLSILSPPPPPFPLSLMSACVWRGLFYDHPFWR